MLTSGKAVRFSSADFGKELFWETFNLFALYFMINALNMPANMAGLMLMMVLIIDALSDPVAGIIFDRMTKSRKTLFLFFIIMPVLCSILLITFYGSQEIIGISFGFIIAVMVLFRLSYTFVDVPINAVTAYLARTESGKSLLWGLRKGAAAMAALLLSVLGTPMRDAIGSDEQTGGFLIPVALLSLLACGAYATSWFALPKTWRTEPERRNNDVADLVSTLVRSGRFWGIMTVLLINASILGLVGRAAIFLTPAGDVSLPSYSFILAALVTGRILSILIVSIISIRHGRRISLWLVLGIVWLSSAGLFFVTGELALLILFAANGFSTGGIALVAWSYSPDMLDDAHVAANDLVATSLGLFSMVVKMGTGLGAGILAGLLAIEGAHEGTLSAGGTGLTLLQLSALLTLAGGATITACAILLPPFRHPRPRIAPDV